MQTILKVLLIYFLLGFNLVKADGHSSNENWSFYTGTFDFSDDGKKATLFGVQHINTGKNKESFLGTLKPVTGLMVTADNAAYIYTGFQIYNEGPLKFTPSFKPGVYSEGDGKDLGLVIEFKTEIQISYEFSKNSEIAVSYNHISNASLGDKNPGANSYMFNYIKKF